jgi:hypothetical protein
MEIDIVEARTMMRIELAQFYRVEYEGVSYRRSIGGEWEELMGESWESSWKSEELEEEFERFMEAQG